MSFDCLLVILNSLLSELDFVCGFTSLCLQLIELLLTLRKESNFFTNFIFFCETYQFVEIFFLMSNFHFSEATSSTTNRSSSIMISRSFSTHGTKKIFCYLVSKISIANEKNYFTKFLCYCNF